MNAIFDKNRWDPLERKIWIYALAAVPAWFFYCIVTGILLFDKADLERVPDRLSPVFGERVIIPGDVDSMSQGFRDLLQPNQQTRSDSAAHREAQRAQDGRIADAQERNRIKDAANRGYVWKALSKGLGYPIAWLGALLTLFEVRARLDRNNGTTEASKDDTTK